jgi:hypothetical protein
MEQDKAKIMAYLKSGHLYRGWHGMSYCRFGCKFESRQPYANPPNPESNLTWGSLIASWQSEQGIEPSPDASVLPADELHRGVHDLSDGEWVWPEGLVHYIRNHDVCLPDDFIETMRQNDWTVPAVTTMEFQYARGINRSYWINWAIRHFQRKQIDSVESGVKS